METEEKSDGQPHFLFYTVFCLVRSNKQLNAKQTADSAERDKQYLLDSEFKTPQNSV